MTLATDLIRDEGLRLKPYVDTVGKVTIGVGRNLTDNGITIQEAHAMLEGDIVNTERELTATFPWYATAPEPVRRGLANCHFNMGLKRLQGFHGMLGALAAGDYAEAAVEALDSTWAAQVGDRAKRIAQLFLSAKG